MPVRDDLDMPFWVRVFVNRKTRPKPAWTIAILLIVFGALRLMFVGADQAWTSSLIGLVALGVGLCWVPSLLWVSAKGGWEEERRRP